MNRMKVLKISILATISMVLVACSQIIPESKHNIQTSYKEWAKQIGLYSTENVKVGCYEGDNEICLGLEYENGLSGYMELCELINKHNKFVDDNLNYFPNDLKITFYNMAGPNQPDISVFSNSDYKRLDIEEYIDELNYQKTAKIQYMCIDMKRADIELEENQIPIDVPVIIMKSHDESYIPSGRVFAFLKDYKNAKQVIMDFWSEHDKDDLSKEIHEYLPDVEIYDVIHVTGQDYLEKCQ